MLRTLAALGIAALLSTAARADSIQTGKAASQAANAGKNLPTAQPVDGGGHHPATPGDRPTIVMPKRGGAAKPESQRGARATATGSVGVGPFKPAQPVDGG